MKLAHFSGPKEIAQDSHIVGAKESLKLCHGGLRPRHVPGKDQRTRVYTRIVIVSEALPTIVQLKKAP